MPTKHPTSKSPAKAPIASRPHIPDYGIPKSKTGMLPWSHVTERMEKAKAYWVATVDARGRPHATPVDGAWIDDALYFGGSPKVRWNRNLTANPNVCIHIGLDYDVVIMHGMAEPMGALDHALAVRVADTINAKYGYGVKAENYEQGPAGAYVFRPRTVFAWSSFPKDVTRWRP